MQRIEADLGEQRQRWLPLFSEGSAWLWQSMLTLQLAFGFNLVITLGVLLGAALMDDTYRASARLSILLLGLMSLGLNATMGALVMNATMSSGGVDPASRVGRLCAWLDHAQTLVAAAADPSTPLLKASSASD